MSLKLLLDENISPRVASGLRYSGYDAVHPREVGLKGARDSEIVAFASENKRCLVTLDADFADLRNYRLGEHGGIIRLKLKFALSSTVLSALLSLLPKLVDVPMEKGALVVSDGRRYKIRLPKQF